MANRSENPYLIRLFWAMLKEQLNDGNGYYPSYRQLNMLEIKYSFGKDYLVDFFRGKHGDTVNEVKFSKIISDYLPKYSDWNNFRSEEDVNEKFETYYDKNKDKLKIDNAVKERLRKIYRVNSEIEQSTNCDIFTYPKILSSFKSHIDFQERNEELGELRSLLQKNNQILVVNGMGGLGKSTIANALSLFDMEDYKHLIWLNISQGLQKSVISNKQLIYNLMLTDRINKIKLFFDIEKHDYEIFNIIISAIRNIREKSLIVLDDANSEFEHEFSHLGLSKNWNIVITSRIHYNNIPTYKLPGLTKNKAINLFYYYSKKITKTEENTITNGRIVSSVWLHTLSIELLGKTILNSFDLTPSKLENLLLENGLKEISEYEIKTAYFSEKTRTNSVITSVLKCLKVAFDIGDFSRNPLITKILKHFALLPSTPLSYNVLLELLGVKPISNVKFQNKLRRLIDLGWIVETHQGIYMHPIIQESIRNTYQLNIKNSIDFIKNLTRLIDDYRNLEKTNLTLYVTFSKNLLKNFTTLRINQTYLEFIIRFSKLLNEIGYPKDTLEIIDNLSLDKKLKQFANEINFEKAKAFLILEKLEESLTLLNALSNVYNNQSQLHGEVLYHIGVVNKKLFNKTKNEEFIFDAINYTQKSIDIFNNLSDTDTYISSSFMLMAQLLKRQNKRDLAKEYFEKAEKIRLKEYGENHFKTAIIWGELGVLYNEIGDYENGISYTKKAIDVKLNYYGEDSLELAVPYHNYAHCFFKTNKYETALEFELKCFEILKNNVSSTDTRYQNAVKRLSEIRERMPLK